LAGESFKVAVGGDAQHIPYKGSVPNAYAAILKADFDRYGRIVKISGAKAD